MYRSLEHTHTMEPCLGKGQQFSLYKADKDKKIVFGLFVPTKETEMHQWWVRVSSKKTAQVCQVLL